jgi:Family of unknown function (DUF6496)
MPDERSKRRARQDKAEGKAASTQAGEFVREEIEHVREGKHGARSAKQAIAIGLSKARRAGVALPVPKKGSTSERTRTHAARDSAQGRQDPERVPSARRSRAGREALQREPSSAATATALSRHARAAARAKSPAERSAAAHKAALTKAAARRRTPSAKAKDRNPRGARS